MLGVRQPLLTAVGRGLRGRHATRSALDASWTSPRPCCASRSLELHWLAIDLLERTIAREPEQTWQLVRAEARRAGDWITVDRLAHSAGRGILAEPYRWAELEQLVYSPSRWERRLVGSTIATIPHRGPDRRPHARDRPPRPRASWPTSSGDAEPDVQKALSWALRTLADVDLARDGRVPARRGAHRARDRATATARGSSVTRDREAARRRSPPSCAPPSTACASAPAPHRPRGPRRPPRTSSRSAWRVPPAERAVIDRT